MSCCQVLSFFVVYSCHFSKINKQLRSTLNPSCRYDLISINTSTWENSNLLWDYALVLSLKWNLTLNSNWMPEMWHTHLVIGKKFALCIFHGIGYNVIYIPCAVFISSSTTNLNSLYSAVFFF